MKSKFRRAACACLSAVMSVTLVSGSVLASADVKDKGPGNETVKSVSFEDVTGKVNLNSVALQHLNSSVLENAGLSTKSEKKTVIVTLEEDCLIDSLPENKSAAEYLNTYTGSKVMKKIETSQKNFLTSLSSLGVNYKVIYKYSAVVNAVAIEIDTSDISKVKSVKSVKSTAFSQTYAYPEDAGSTASGETSNPNNVYATGIYDSSAYVAKGYDGSGMTVAVLDTGLDYTHSAFQKMPEVQGMTYEDVKHTVATKNLNAVRLSAANGKNISADDLYVNAKVPFAYDYADRDTDVYPGYSQHGAHVAGIVAGEDKNYKNKDGVIAKDENGDEIPFYGVAPQAQLVICKVFTDDFDSKDLGGAITEDIVASLDDCVMLGVDVINMSLGTTAGFSSGAIEEGDDDGELLATCYAGIKAAGINLVCAASNDFSSGYGGAYGTNLATNPDSGTVGSPSTFTGSLSVASINGQLAPFMVANADTENNVKGSVIYFQDSSDENGKRNDFVNEILGDAANATFRYVVIGGTGSAGDYTSTLLRYFTPVDDGGLKQPGEKVIAVVKRGSNTFKDKVQIAQDKGADGIIIYNNVAGSIGISLGDLEDPIPAVSVTMDAGTALTVDSSTGRRRTTGTIEVNKSYQAGPFMNDYSSWGTTPDLKIKPEVTAHGGEITSTVSGGYAEMSGTSMATPNLAGFVALLRGKLKQENPDLSATALTRLVNQIVMSTAVMVYDQDGLPYSPRKQGSGLATLDNVFTTKAYLYTDESNCGAEDDRPKVELGADTQKNGVYKIKFYVKNFGSETLKFTPKAAFMTETLSGDGLAVAEKAHLFNDNAPQWNISGNGVTYASDVITVTGNNVAYIEVTLTLSNAEKDYINTSFKNGMFVEGFITLESATNGQCSLNLPFMGFFGDWKAAPMLDYDIFELAEYEKDSSLKEEEKPQASVWATQAYATYSNEKYSVPLGSFCYTQNDYADQIYANADYVAVSRYNEYFGDNAANNYLTTTSIKALYTGLLRNAELVTYDLYDDNTGELLLQNRLYHVSKAYTAAGSTVPANVKLELYPEQLGLVNNGKYRIDFHFYFDKDDEGQDSEDNSYSLAFHVDYEAPVLVSSKIRYYDYKENNKDKQRVYLDLEVFDNHYAQAVVLCYGEYDKGGQLKLYLATEYVTPVYNANKNGTTTVSIEITDFYEDYKGRLYVQLDDYALNHSVYNIVFSDSNTSTLPDTFEIAGDTEITLGLYQTYKVALDYEGTANLSNFTWSVTPRRIAVVENGEIFAIEKGDATVTVTNPVTGMNRRITVHVVDGNTVLSWPSLSFGTIVNSDEGVQKASGTVKVNAGQDFKLNIEYDPWYYPWYKTLKFRWESNNPEVASVDQEGNVSTWDKKGVASISATILNDDGTATAYAAIVSLSVQEPFTISGGTVTAYHGRGGDVEFPKKKNVTTIASEAFKDNDNITSIVIPKTVTQISERAFINCTALKAVYFDQKEATAVPDSSLSLILKDAFAGCTALETVDLTNVKTITLASRVFKGCTSLKNIVHMENIGTMNESAFEGCTSLKEIDITDLHNTGADVFKNCTSLETVHTGYYSSIGESMFSGCTSLKEITINAPAVLDYAFENCTNLKTVNFGGSDADEKLERFTIGNGAFYNCINLTKVNFNGYVVTSIGHRAFEDCEKLQTIDIPEGTVLGVKVFDGTLVTGYDDDMYNGAVYSGTTLVLAPSVIPSDFTVRAGTTVIADGAFEGCTFPAGMTLVIPDTVTRIGVRAFANSNIKSIKLSANLIEIPYAAFMDSGVTSVTLPDGLKQIGIYAFAYCRSLTEINIPASVEEIEMFAFSGSRLESVSFAQNSNLSFIGNYAFYSTSLASIVIPDKVTALNDCTFMFCNALTSVDLNKVTVIGSDAFASCSRLTTVKGLEKVTYIGEEAFYNTSLTSLNISKAKTIGAFAFYGNGESSVTIPASLASLGDGAFANSAKLASFTVENGNSVFFADDGVLYRVISEGQLRLCAYPSAKAAAAYEVKAGTVSVQGYSFNGLHAEVKEVKLPYTVKVIGAGAFASSGIKSYVFESIEAPVLQSAYLTTNIMEASMLQYYVSELASSRSLHYNNFQDVIQNYLYDDVFVGEKSTLKISYPSNGSGYTNYVYSHFFGETVSLGELMDETTRSLKSILESFYSVSEVESWNKLDASNADNVKMVSDFSESVKSAHAVYNTITSKVQLDYLGADNVQKLFDIESALKSVKTRFGIAVKVTSFTISEDSTHKTEYKAGDRFDMTGLKLIVTNDDYSVEQADMTKVKLVSSYDRELTTFDRYVALEYNGRTVQVRITVTEAGETPPPGPGPDDPPVKENCNSSIFSGGSAFIALGLLCVVCLTVTIIRKRKKND